MFYFQKFGAAELLTQIQVEKHVGDGWEDVLMLGNFCCTLPWIDEAWVVMMVNNMISLLGYGTTECCAEVPVF